MTLAIRLEAEGVHLYERNTGLHVLLDEIPVQANLASVGPRTLSLAITNVCDFNCWHCHIKKGSIFLPIQQIIQVCQDCEQLGTLDVALGGGEPTLHPDFIPICQRLWNESRLGVSFTTHGHHLSLDLVNSIIDSVSFVRVSLDGPEPLYSRRRNRPLSELLAKVENLRGRIPFGFNVLICNDTIPSLDSVLNLALEYQAQELLLLPIIRDETITLSHNDWKNLNEWIATNYKSLPIRVGSYARKYLNGPFLFDPLWEQDYAYLGADGILRDSSYETCGLRLSEYQSTMAAIQAWRLKRNHYCSNKAIVPNCFRGARKQSAHG